MLAGPHSKLKQQLQPTAAAAAPFKSTTPPCRFHARGLCAKGDACPFFHASPAAQAPTPTPTPAEWESETPAGRSRPDPTTLRGAAAAAQKKQQWQQAFGGKVGKNGTQRGARAAGVGWGGGAARSGRAAANNGRGGSVWTGADAAAKARAADILQKHRWVRWSVVRLGRASAHRFV